MSKEQESVEQLLLPRYKVIADYPGQRFQIGDVVETYESAMCYAIGNSPHSEPEWSEKVSLIDYPAVFQKLQWWEDRKPEEMPRYVKDEFGRIGELGERYHHNLKDCVNVKFENGNAIVAHLDNFKPISEQEYNSYLKTKTP